MLQPWIELAVPHVDIRKGKFDESVFAADLSDVVADRGPLEYRDARTFFTKTYPTHGLVQLVAAVLARLCGKGFGEPVIQIQTPFGGGKTHSLIALYHLFRAPEEVQATDLCQEVMRRAGVDSLPDVRVVSFVGTVADPLKGRTPWGEIAYQLGCYKLVQEHDQKRRAPGKELLHQILGDQPTLILMDEIAQYVVKGKDFADQVQAFFQELTETVKVLPRCALVVTLPSSAPYGEEGERRLSELQRIFGRVEAIYTPVEGEEVYEVIRRRLFDTLPEERKMRQVANAYWEFYNKLGEDLLPREVREPAYRDKMARAYPFHPDVINFLFERWSTYSTFQRTRGVLRLLAEVVGDLYRRSHRAPLIQPAHLNLAHPAIRREFLKHIGNEYEGVIASDIAGANAKAQKLDQEMGSEYARFGVAQGLATSIFFGSFSAGEKQGVSEQRLRLAVLQEDLQPAIVGDTLRRLEAELWYLHVEGGLYAFRSQPNLNRIIVEREEVVKEEQVQEEIRARLEKLAGREMSVTLWPSTPGDVPDTKDLKLAILGPEYLHPGGRAPAFVAELLTKVGQTYRVYRNTLLVLAPDEREWTELKVQVKRFLALRSIQGDKALKRQLSEENQRTLENNLKNAEGNIGFRLLSVYRHLARAGEKDSEWHDLGLPTSGERISLAARVRNYLRDQDLLAERISPHFLLSKALAEGEKEKPVRDILEAFLKYSHLPILDSEEVVWQAVEQGVREGVFGLRLGEKVYFSREPLPPTVREEEAILLRPEAVPAPSAAMPEAVTSEADSSVPSEATATPSREGSVSSSPPTLAEGYRLRARIPWDKLFYFMQGVIGPLRNDGADLVVEVMLEARGSIKKETLNYKIRETLKQIGAEVLEEQPT